MTDTLVQFLGLVGLSGGVALGWWRWIRGRSLDRAGRGLLLLLIFTLVGGLLGSTGWWFSDPRSFSWLLPPLASRMLAAAAWSFALVAFFALERPTRARLRLALLMLAVYFIPLLIAIVLFHLNRFDFSAPITYFFFGISLGMAIATVGYLLRIPTIVGVVAEEPGILTPIARLWLVIVAIGMVVWGLALFATDAGPSDLIWAWPGDLLTSRLISVMLFTIAAGALYALRNPAIVRPVLWCIVVYGVGVSAASLWNMLVAKPIKPAYAIAFGIMAIGSVAVLAGNREAVQKR